jgi:signal transduction histidine kinase
MERASRHAMESDRLKSAFLRNLSHEIRTPLNAIVGFSSLLNEPENSPGERQEITDILMHNTDHLLELFTDIIEISNIEADAVKIRKSEVNVKDLLGRLYDRFRTKVGEKGILLDISDDKTVGAMVIITDGYKLFQILAYLLDNAIKFTEKGKVEVRYSINDKIIEFNISDTGIGIPSELHGRIFDRFYQVESGPSRRYEGAGLGLSISKAYIELLGGEIWFTSQTGEGSVFSFTLPYERKIV